ncbi:MAG: MASE1 domain-containing protein [Methylovulum sp.]|nr:MASE1 domain-containing protein [Methylovulum sp.]
MQKHSYSWQDLLRMASLAIVYTLLASLVLNLSTANGNVTIFWIPGGLALAALLVWGSKYWPAVYIGAFSAGIIVNDPPSVSFFLATGNTLETLTAFWFLRCFKMDISFNQLSDFYLLGLAAISCALISALIGPFTLLMAQYLNWQNISYNILHWWQGDMLGILLSTPLFLIWRKFPHQWFTRENLAETFVLFGLCILTGQIVFLGWFYPTAGDLAKGYWLFLFVVWAAIRRGQHGASLVVCITAIQALLGAVQGAGYFAQDIVNTGLQNFWVYLLILTLVGITLATFFESKIRAENALINAMHYQRALLDNFPFMVWLKDTESRFLAVNKGFVDASGVHDNQYLIGKTDFDIYPQELAEGYREDDIAVMKLGAKKEIEEEVLAQGARKWFETYKAPVIAADGRILGTVGFARDITKRKQSEQNRLTHEIKLRKTLIREVHHRIKNSLQGVTGLLNQAMTQHPELTEAVTKVIGQIRSIAVTHGLQGSNQNSQVILHDLVRNAVEDNQSLWPSPLVVDIQANVPAWQITEEELVPLALVLNELVFNAIKHSVAHTEVRIELHGSNDANNALLTISNVGQLSKNAGTPHAPEMGTGLTLLDFLLPEHGASVSWEQSGELVLTRLVLTSPVITLISTEIQS